MKAHFIEQPWFKLYYIQAVTCSYQLLIQDRNCNNLYLELVIVVIN